MNWASIVTVYLKELKDALRDRRTLISTIVVPVLIMPVLTLTVGTVMSKVISKTEAEIPVVMIVGGEDSPGIVAQLKGSKKLRVVPLADGWEKQISDKKIPAAVRIPDGFEAGLRAMRAQSVTIYHFAGELKSNHGAQALEDFFRELRDRSVAARLTEKGLPATFAKPFDLTRENVASSQKVAGNSIGGFIPYLIIMLCLVGAAVPATDLTAGEKERGTMETLLCSPVARADIVLGKFLLVLTGSLSAMGLALLSMALTFLAVGSVVGAGGRAAKLAATAGQAKAAGASLPSIDPLGVLGVLAMVLPVAVLFSALTFTIGLFAKSAKEAQSYLAPLMFVVIMPAIIGMLPGIDLNARLALVPLLNLSLVCREMLSGTWHWDYIALIFGSSCVYAAAALGFAVRMFNREDVIFRT